MGKGIRCKFFFLICDKCGASIYSSLQSDHKRFFAKGRTEPKSQREQYYADELRELRKHWNELIYGVCDGDPGKMTALRKMEVHQFFDYLENCKKLK